MSIIGKIFGDANQKYVSGLQPVVDKINSLEENLKKLSQGDLKKKATDLKEKIKNGENLDNALPEAFALVRETSRRSLNQRHFDSQIIGGIVLHQGKIAEMKTGEGKTLAATLPLFLNALEGKGAHTVTVNDYLAKRDAVWMGQIFHALGLSVGCIVHDESFIYDPDFKASKENLEEKDKARDEVGGFKIIESYLKPVARKEAYMADITYGTNNEFGFDYLKDNMVYDLSQQVQRGFNYAVVDEIDSILIDEARTPLIISAPDMESSEYYREFAKITPQLSAEKDYQIDEKMKAATLTEEGINKIEKILGVGNIYEERGVKFLHYLEQSLRAETLFKKDRDYVVKNGEVIIVDEFTGRMMPGRRWSGGLHQAIEAKEGVQVKPESLTLASITFQNYFRMYKKLAGMTGTASTSAEEFDKVYGLEVVAVPTNKPMIREDLADVVYKTEEGKFKALAREIAGRHAKGQPILVGTTSIEKNEYLGKILDREGVPHQILNAKHHEQEGEIIAQAGKLGQVTIATNMAGRGVDIILGGNPQDEEMATRVRQLGGLHVIGTERHEARRIDNQLRGRSGRQGDPGSSQFYLSLEDDLLRIFGSDRLKSLMNMLKLPEDQPIEAKLISGAIESAQGKIEGFNFDVRKHVLDYDDVMNKHREVFYKKRKEIIEKNPQELRDYILESVNNSGLKEEDYLNKEKEIGEERMRQVERIVVLRIMDMHWLDHLENMSYLRDSVKLRAYGQKDPLIEYKSEGHKMFQDLLKQVELGIAGTILKVKMQEQPSAESRPQQVFQSAPKVGRNDPCPCGSGKKFKKCRGN
ncbi:MAG: preprotein translocase subunit SecA [Candidatus Pacebacteria bacterium]|nr:preprotein translocase subunit SecA [Candidatus Paceibacterota bacterium]